MTLQICYLIKAIMSIFMGIGIGVLFYKSFVLALFVAVIVGVSNIFATKYLLEYDIKDYVKELEEGEPK